MAIKFPKVSEFNSQPIGGGRHAIFENGEYICQLRAKEVSSWLFKARRSSEKHAIDEASITVTRVINALEYIASRKSRVSSNEVQLSLI